MPMYDYACEACKHRFERLQPMNAPRESECPRCGGAAHRVLVSGPGVVVRGGRDTRTRAGSEACSCGSSYCNLDS